MEATLTYVGAATVLLEVGGWRFLTDPVLDPPGGVYALEQGPIRGEAARRLQLRSRKLTGLAIAPENLPPIHAVLLSHDQHFDNLDAAGRAFLPQAERVLTTVSGAKRLGGNASGLAPWQSVQVGEIRITATPAQHGPRIALPVVGEVIGFFLEWPGQRHGGLYISGDTVWFAGLAQVARRFKVSAALLHVGAARFRLTGPIRYTLDAREALKLAERLEPRTLIPIHHEGWSHFSEGRAEVERAFREAGLEAKTLWLEPGVPTRLEV
ncbi:MBL fold metallo-hydrolase [Calidithermus roseus]|uniref:Beta-lactamase superfamily domain protein n=1 Tax=Calidithermus roseus TaxID=1644118 RepID=A0A399ELP7_9DEIN|nr:MBL fold metallo-hydrolase [Calidithermus roseus]RIH83979.1 Beta-lactamase superfamily domain protein [Calidithermus roseus]